MFPQDLCEELGIVGEVPAVRDGDICVGGPAGELPNACSVSRRNNTGTIIKLHGGYMTKCFSYTISFFTILQGDSGGPTTCYHNGRWTVVGVASWVLHCHTSPTIYTGTPYFLDWINTSIELYEERSKCGTKPEQREWTGPDPVINTDDDSVILITFKHGRHCIQTKYLFLQT